MEKLFFILQKNLFHVGDNPFRALTGTLSNVEEKCFFTLKETLVHEEKADLHHWLSQHSLHFGLIALQVYRP